MLDRAHDLFMYKLVACSKSINFILFSWGRNVDACKGHTCVLVYLVGFNLLTAGEAHSVVTCWELYGCWCSRTLCAYVAMCCVDFDEIHDIYLRTRVITFSILKLWCTMLLCCMPNSILDLASIQTACYCAVINTDCSCWGNHDIIIFNYMWEGKSQWHPSLCMSPWYCMYNCYCGARKKPTHIKYMCAESIHWTANLLQTISQHLCMQPKQCTT